MRARLRFRPHVWCVGFTVGEYYTPKDFRAAGGAAWHVHVVFYVPCLELTLRIARRVA